MSSGTEDQCLLGVHTLSQQAGRKWKAWARCSLGLKELVDVLMNKEETRASESG